jgi:hypothetical protein
MLMSRKNRNQKFEEDDRDLPRSARERPRGRGRGDRPNRERRKLPQEHAVVAMPSAAPAPAREETGIVTILSEPRIAPSKRICGLCRNWFDRGVIGGRGECDHPGSGILFPYDDTPACDFFVRR